MPVSGRHTHHQHKQYLKYTIDIAKQNAEANRPAFAVGTYKIGRVPRRAFVAVGDVKCYVHLALDGSATIDIGTNASSYNNLLATANITEATPGEYQSTAAFYDDDEDVDVYVVIGGTPTVGRAIITIEYTPDTEQYQF